MSLLTIRCQKQIDGSVMGVKPDGTVITWPEHSSSKPDMRYRYTTHNCFRWRVLWVSPLETLIPPTVAPAAAAYPGTPG